MVLGQRQIHCDLSEFNMSQPRNLPIFALLFLLLQTPANRTLAAEKLRATDLLDPNRVLEIRLEMPEESWNKLRRQTRDASTAFNGLPNRKPYTYVKADLWIGDQKIKSVGVRKKGFFGSADTQRPSLKIKFDEYVDQDPVSGLSRITLNNNKQDRSLASQFLTYQLFRRAGNPAPRSNWAHVTVNGRSLGVYTHVESVRKPFLKHNFEKKSGNLYEGTLTDFHHTAVDSLEAKTNEDDNDRTDAESLARLLNTDGPLNVQELEKQIDLPAFLRHWALESLIGFWDGYSSNQNNYFIYFRPSDGRGVFIPWGADASFTSRTPFSFGMREVGPIYAQAILANRLYRAEGIPERYRETMQSILKRAFNEEHLLAETDRIQKLLEPYVGSTQADYAKGMDEIRSFVRRRRATMEKALETDRLEIPREPRSPSYLVDEGELTGSFSAPFDGDGESTAEFKVTLGDSEMSITGATVEASLAAPSRSWFNRGGSGDATPPEEKNISLVIKMERDGEEPVTASVTLHRLDLEDPIGKTIEVSGTFREGAARRSFGFRGFGGESSQYVIGDLTLEELGLTRGDVISGDLKLRIVRSRGGFFARRGEDNRPPSQETQEPEKPKEPNVFLQALTITRALDTDRDRTISAEEIEQASERLKTLDLNKDGKLDPKEMENLFGTPRE